MFQLAAVNLQENDRNIFNLLNPLDKISEGDPNPKRYTFFGQLYSDTIVGQPHPVRKKTTHQTTRDLQCLLLDQNQQSRPT